MNTLKRSVGRRLVAALGVAALSLAGAVGITTAANAATNIPTDPGSIHITKLVQPSVAGSAATGKQNASISGTPVKDVQYTLYRANLQLTSSNAESTADWTTIDNISKLVQAGYVPSTPTDGTVTIGSSSSNPSTITLNDLTKVGETTTNADGLADFTNLAPDLYLVVESLPAAGTTPPVTSTAAPFFVSIPLPVSTTVASSGWLSDVYVYPKNPTSTKTVDDKAALGAGDVFPWTVTAQIPVTATNEGIGSFTISDTLDSRLVYDSYAVKISDNTALTSPADYTVTEPTGASGGVFKIEFTDTGRTTLANHGGKSVVLTLNTSVTADAGNGIITNTAVVNDHNTTQASTYWGNVKVFKYSSAGTLTGLNGAQFKVYTDEDALHEVTFGKDATGNPILKTFTSKSDGSVIIDALKTAETGSTTYYLKEVQAPDGFVPITDPIPVQVHRGQTTATALTQTPANNYVPVANTPRTGPSLPLTGANGQLLALIGGGSLVLLAAGTALVARKRSHQD